MPEFVLQVLDIDETGKDYSFVLTREWLDATLGDAGLRGDPEQPIGSLTVHAQKNGNEFLVEGKVRAALITDCVRCLGVAHVPVSSHFATLFNRTSVPRGSGSSKRAAAETLEMSEEDDDDLQREDFSGHEIVLDDLVREYLVLDAPMQPLCSEQCEGIAVPKHVRPPEEVFGPSDGSVDPRLAPLLRLRDKVPPNKE
jgi:uncharacterized protein